MNARTTKRRELLLELTKLVEAITVGIKIFIFVPLVIPTRAFSTLISYKMDTEKQIRLAIKKNIAGDHDKWFWNESIWTVGCSLVLGNNCLQLVNVGSSEVGNLNEK